MRTRLLEDIVVYLARRTAIRSARIQKLMYLVEAEYADRVGERLMDYDFHHDKYGMNSQELKAQVLGMGKGNGPLEIRFYATDGGGRGFRAILRPGVPDPKLPKAVQEVCDSVLKSYAKRYSDIRSLAAAAKNTFPFAGTKPGDRVDWSTLVHECDRGKCEHKLSPRGRERLLRSMKA